MKRLLAVFPFVLIAGCADLKQAGADLHARVAGWLNPPESSIDAAEPLYCYRTIADEECYTHPLPGEEERLIGHVGQAPEPR